MIPQPFQVGEKVRPHVSFRHYYPGITECEVTSCEKGKCDTGWLITVKEFNNKSLGKQEFDSSWFFKIKQQ